MRAAVVKALSQGLEAAEVAEPTRGAGQALLEVRAAAINPLDQLVAAGKFYLGHPELPYVPGIEGVGVVLEGDTLKKGTRVRFEGGVMAKYGGFAERTVVAENAVIPLPENISDPVAACLGIAGWAGWLSVAWRAKLVKGEKVLVLGATGAVGQVAIQAAKLLGAGRIVAAGRDAASLEGARQLGADALVVLDGRPAPELAAAFTQAAGGPLDVVIDPLWGVPALGAIMAAAPNARLVNLGQSAGDPLPLPSAAIRGKMVSVLGYTNALVPREERQAAFLKMVEHASKGELKINHEVFSLEQAPEAWKAQMASPHRKLVVVPRR